MDWFVLGDAARNDVMNSAEKCAGRTGVTQKVHEHAMGEECKDQLYNAEGEPVGRGCIEVEPGEWPPGQAMAREVMQRAWSESVGGAGASEGGAGESEASGANDPA